MKDEKKPKATEAQIKAYNDAVASLNETEDFEGENRIKCIRIVGDIIEYYNCKTGEVIK